MDHMKRALSLAQQALGNCSPNPTVGAVLIKEGQVVGEGFTQPPGQPHAEIVALHQAGSRAQGATLYVTLEPCCHHGRTPPCTSRIIQAGVSEVRFALLDPDPRVNGKGGKELEQAGVRVIVGEDEEEARKLNEAYFTYTQTHLPYVVAKYAASMDGKIATREGNARWITSAAARRRSNELRGISDAVAVGIGTILADDPQLTVRDDKDVPNMRQPLRIVIDSVGRTPTTARLLQEPGEVIIVGAHIPPRRAKALRQAGAELIELPAEDGSVNLKALLTQLGKRDITSLLIEGGGALLGSFFDQGLIDKTIAFIAPIIIGGANAVPAVAGTGSASIAQAMRLRNVTVEHIGEDLMVVGYPEKAFHQYGQS